MRPAYKVLVVKAVTDLNNKINVDLVRMDFLDKQKVVDQYNDTIGVRLHSTDIRLLGSNKLLKMVQHT
jgi:hypothetical protein